MKKIVFASLLLGLSLGLHRCAYAADDDLDIVKALLGTDPRTRLQTGQGAAMDVLYGSSSPYGAGNVRGSSTPAPAPSVEPPNPYRYGDIPEEDPEEDDDSLKQREPAFRPTKKQATDSSQKKPYANPFPYPHAPKEEQPDDESKPEDKYYDYENSSY